MKRYLKILLVTVFVQTQLTQCIDNTITDVNNSNPDYIGFSSTTTRAATSDLTTLQNDGNGFRVYATAGNNPADWYKDDDNHRIDGTNKYRYTFGEWSFDTPVKWPVEANGYPMTFYAYHPSSPAGFSVASDFSSGLTHQATYTVQDVAGQVDLLVARNTTNSKPATGNLTLTFKHILSKVNFGIIAGEGVVPQIQSLQVINIGDTRTYDFIADDWSSTPQALSGNAAYYYYGMPNGDIISDFTPPIRDERTSNTFYSGVHNNHLMLMPQRASIWKPQSGMAPDATSGGYISVVYRMRTGEGTNGVGTTREVGFTDASLHPDYSTAGNGVTGPLYVQAGFPLPAADGFFTWDKNRSYVYNIALGVHGSCNGYILNDYYFDGKGNRTNLKLIEVRNEGKKVGDQLQAGKIQVTLEVDDWDNQSGGEIRPGKITVTPRNVLLRYNEPAPAAKSLTVNCLTGYGSPDPAAKWTLKVPDTQSWLKLSLDPNTTFANASTTLSDITGTQTVYIYTTNNMTGTYRNAPLILNDEQTGLIHQVCNYLNFSFTSPSAFTTYVGAFWRSDQKGERIIRVQVGANNGNYGNWTASVAWLDQHWGVDDAVFLSVDKLPGMAGADPNIYTANAHSAEDYQVIEENFSVSGNVSAANQYITFRIGLKSKYYPTTNYPARYALVLLSYGNNSKHQRIFLRQGHDPDYLMKNGDEVGTNSEIASRTVAKMFSPFNLTATTIETHVDQRGVAGTNPGTFTDFPSQTGAFFQWANTYIQSGFDGGIRWAFSPYASTESYQWSMATPAIDKYWNSLSAAHETCPAGYRRPSDGRTDIDEHSTKTSIVSSELRQSLYEKVFSGYNSTSDITNSLWGYYADGFFDRHPITNSTTVAAGLNSIAHVGRLVYNPHSSSDRFNASLFFPAGGFRYFNTGNLTNAGSEGMYWTSSADNSLSTPLSLIMYFKSNNDAPWRAEKSTGAMIRCVKE